MHRSVLRRMLTLIRIRILILILIRIPILILILMLVLILVLILSIQTWRRQQLRYLSSTFPVEKPSV